MTTANFVVQRRSSWGVRRIYGYVDPNVPPMPHISLEQAKAFASSVLKGDVNALGFLKQTVKDIAARSLRGEDYDFVFAWKWTNVPFLFAVTMSGVPSPLISPATT
jgi:hypothetical protein